MAVRERGNYICLYVKDTGNGIDPELLARIFAPFLPRKRKGKEPEWGWLSFMESSAATTAP